MASVATSALEPISDRIDAFLGEHPEGVKASVVVARMSAEGYSRSAAAAALVDGIDFRRYDLDVSFRLRTAHMATDR